MGAFASILAGMGEIAEQEQTQRMEREKEQRTMILETLKDMATRFSLVPEVGDEAQRLLLYARMSDPRKPLTGDKKFMEPYTQLLQEFNVQHRTNEGQQKQQAVQQGKDFFNIPQLSPPPSQPDRGPLLNRANLPGMGITPRSEPVSAPPISAEPSTANLGRSISALPPMPPMPTGPSMSPAARQLTAAKEMEQQLATQELDRLILEAERIGLTDPSDIANFIRRQYVNPKSPEGGGVQILRPGETLVVNGEALYTAPVAPGESGRRQTITAGPDDTILDADGTVLWRGPQAKATEQTGTPRPTTQWESNLQRQESADSGARQWISQAGNVADAYRMALAANDNPAVLLRLLELSYEENRSLSEQQRARADITARYAPGVVKDAERLIEQYGSPESALQFLESGSGPAVRVGVKELLRELGGLAATGRPRSIFE